MMFLAFLAFTSITSTTHAFNCLLDLEGTEQLSDVTSLLDRVSNAPSETELICSGVGLTGSIPSSIGNFVALELLDLSDNEIEGNIPIELTAVQSLRAIDLSGNCLTGELDKVLRNINKNKFSGEISDLPSSIVNFSARLNDLSGGLSNEKITGFPNLENLDLFGNRLSGTVEADTFQGISLRSLFLNNNGLSGTIPPNTAANTDVVSGDSFKTHSFSQRWFKFTLDEKCPNRLSFAIDKMFSDATGITIGFLIGIVLLIVAIGFCITCLTLKCRRSRQKEKISQARNSLDSSVYSDEDHYKIELYLTQCKNPTSYESNLTKIIRSRLKSKRVKPSFGKTIVDDPMKVDHNTILDAAAILIFFSQSYFEEMSNPNKKAFEEVFAAVDSGHFIIFACLEKKLYTVAKTRKLLDSSYHLFDMSSPDAINQNFDDLMVKIYEAQAEKEMVFAQGGI